MATQRFGRAQKAMALVPLTVLSTAWTASLAGFGLSPMASASGDDVNLPDGTTIPSEAIQAPASVSQRGAAPGINGSEQQVIANSSTNGIPAAALAAYQRAETVINAADRSCSMPWQLVAAIGRVESDHGRYGGNTLNDQGIATPGIFGLALDGTHGTSLIRDTDAGQYDNDTVYDRAVGPMQFIPSTWSVVGVDADGDSVRNPQDINDASLASAVYLCSGDNSLATDAGRRAAVYRYNHSQDYVNLVLAIMNAYMAGDYTSVPNSTSSSSYFPIDTGHSNVSDTSHQGHHNNTIPPTQPGDNTPGDTPTDGPTTSPTHEPTQSPTSDPTQLPTDSTGPLDGITSDPVGTLTSAAGDPVGTITNTLTWAQADVKCTISAGLDNPLSSTDPYDICMNGFGY